MHATAAECELCAAINLMRQAAGGGVLVTSHEQLLRLDHDARSSRLERPAEGVPWSFFSLLVEYDALPEPLAMQARLDPRNDRIVGSGKRDVHIGLESAGVVRSVGNLVLGDRELECALVLEHIDALHGPFSKRFGSHQPRIDQRPQ